MSEMYEQSQLRQYRKWRQFDAGTWAWILHKVTGWALTFYLFMHMTVLSTSLLGPTVYTNTIGGLESLLVVRVLELMLLAAGVFHSINGLRLVLVDLGIGLKSQALSFYVSLALTGLAVLASIPRFIGGVL
nr:succinate dehydrogenase, cytochrome b556 subunit [Halobacterium hubeiense]